VSRARAKLQDVDPAQLEQRLAKYERRFYGDLESQLRLMAEQAVDRPMTIDNVPQEVRPMLIGKTGKFLVRVFPQDNIWEREPLEKFVKQVTEACEKAIGKKPTGTPLGLYEFI